MWATMTKMHQSHVITRILGCSLEAYKIKRVWDKYLEMELNAQYGNIDVVLARVDSAWIKCLL